MRANNLMLQALLFISFLGFSSLSYSSTLVGSGDLLSMLQQIQGQWRTACRPSKTSSAFVGTNLSISYTHFVVEKIEYKTSRCISVLRASEDTYRFALRGFQVNSRGESVYAVDFKPEDSFGMQGELYLHNIVALENGKLYLGAESDGKKSERLTYLERKTPYER